MNEELLVSLIGPAIDVATRPRGSGLPDKARYRLRREVRSDNSGIEATGLSRLCISLLDFSQAPGLSPLLGFRRMRPAILYGKCAKAPQLDAIRPGHRSNNFIEYNVYHFYHTVGEMKELTCYVEGQLRFDHYNGAIIVERNSMLILPEELFQK